MKKLERWTRYMFTLLSAYLSIVFLLAGKLIYIVPCWIMMSLIDPSAGIMADTSYFTGSGKVTK